MKRFHVHVSVSDIATAVRFYSSIFGAAPTVNKPDYAKWILQDPRVNFAISNRGNALGVNHLGIQVESSEGLAEVREQLASADSAVVKQTDTSCCYSRSDKYWITDPAGIAWEAFHSLDAVPTYGEDTRENATDGACCVPVSTIKAKSGSNDTPPNKDGACCV
jgi:hypothetical protein